MKSNNLDKLFFLQLNIRKINTNIKCSTLHYMNRKIITKNKESYLQKDNSNGSIKYFYSNKNY